MCKSHQFFLRNRCVNSACRASLNSSQAACTWHYSVATGWQQVAVWCCVRARPRLLLLLSLSNNKVSVDRYSKVARQQDLHSGLM